MGLLILCFFPMVKTHLGIARENLKEVHAIKQEEAIRMAMYELKRNLHEHKHGWEELMKGVENDTYTLTKAEQSTKNSGESGMIILAHVKKEKITRRIYVEKALDHAR